MNKLKARNTLYNDPRYDVVVDSRMLEQHLKEKDKKIADLEQELAESENKVKGFVELFYKKQHENYEQFCEIQELKHQLSITEKALELACEEIGRIEAKFGSAYIRADGYLLDYFKTNAKELLENE